MNEEALKHAFDLFKTDGYNGTIEDYKALIKENEEALSYSHKLFSNDGYNGSIEDFSILVGAGNQQGPVKETANAGSVNQAVDTDSNLENGSLGLQDDGIKTKKVVIVKGKEYDYNDVAKNYGDVEAYVKKWRGQAKIINKAITQELPTVELEDVKKYNGRTPGDILVEPFKGSSYFKAVGDLGKTKVKNNLKDYFKGIDGIDIKENPITDLGEPRSLSITYTNPKTGEKKSSGNIYYSDKEQIVSNNINNIKKFFNEIPNLDLSKNLLKKYKEKETIAPFITENLLPNINDINAQYDSPDLFAPITKTKKGEAGTFTVSGVPVSKRDVTEIVYPYQKEISQAKLQIAKEYSNRNEKITDEELSIKAQEFVRSSLKDKAILEEKLKLNELLIQENPDLQSKLYNTALLLEKESATKYNNINKKIQIEADNYKNVTDAANLFSNYVRNENPTIEDEENLINNLSKIGINFNKEDQDSYIELENGKLINKNLYNTINQLEEKINSSKNNYKELISEANNIAGELEDYSLSLEAYSKNYNLAEKYTTNAVLGLSDIITQTSYFVTRGISSSLGAGLPSSYKNPLNAELDQLAVKYKKSSDEIRNSFVRDVDFDSAFKTPENFGKFLLQELSTQAPIVASIAASGGAATYVIGLSSAGGKMMDMQSEIASGDAQYSELELYAKSLAYGGTEALIERLTTIPILKKAKDTWIRAGKESLLNNSTEEFIKSKYKGLVFDPILEASGEAVTTGFQNLLDNKPFIEGMDHAGFSGWGMGLLFSGIPFAKGLYSSRFSTYEGLSKIRNNKKQLDILTSELNNTSSTEEMNRIESEIQKLSIENDALIRAEEDLVNNYLTPSLANKAVDLLSEQVTLQSEAKSIIDDKSLTEKQKSEKIKVLQTKFDEIVNIKNTALSLKNRIKYRPEFALLERNDKSRYERIKARATALAGLDASDAKIENYAYTIYLEEEAISSNNKAAKVKGSNLKQYETVDEIISDLENDKIKLKEKDKLEAIKQIKNGGDGFNIRDEQYVVLENQVANQLKHIGTHEVGHFVTNALFKNNPVVFKKISDQLLSAVYNADKKLYKQWTENIEKDDNGRMKPAEVMSRFFELVNDNKFGYRELVKAKGIAGLFGTMVQKQFVGDYDFNFRGEEDMVNYMVGLAKKIGDGTLVIEDFAQNEKVQDLILKSEKEAKKGEETEFSKTLSPDAEADLTSKILEVKKLAKENEEIAKKFGKDPIPGVKQIRLENEIRQGVKPIIEKIVINRTKALYDPIAPDQKRNVSREEFQDSMRADIETMILNEFKEGGNTLEKFIVDRSYLRANDLAKRLGIESKIKASLSEVDSEGKPSIQIADDYDPGATLEEIRLEEGRQKKLINPITILGEKLSKEYTEAIDSKIRNITPEDIADLSFAKINDLAPEVTAKFWGTTVKKVTTPSANLATAEIPGMQNIILENADTFIKLLPNGAILEGDTASERLIGTGLGIPRKLQQAFYEQQERTSKGAGLIPFKLKDKITKKEFLETFGINEDGTFEKFGGKDPRAQTILALIRLYGQLTSNTAIRQLADLTDTQKADIKAGAAAIQFSKKSDIIAISDEIQFSGPLRKVFGLKNKDIDFTDREQIENARIALVEIFKKLKEKDYTSGEVANIFIGTARGSWGKLGKKYIPNKANKLVEIVYEKITGKYRYNKFLMAGAADFFMLLNEAFEGVKYKSGSAYIIDGKNEYSLDKVPSQSPNGFVNGSMFKGNAIKNSTIFERELYTKKQRNNLKILVDVLKEMYDNKELTSNQTAMVLATLGSSTNGLIRTAAKLVGYSKQSLIGKLTDKMFRFEHSQPASTTIVELAKLITDKNYPYSFQQLMDGFNVYIIPIKYDKIINKFYSSKSPVDENGNLILSNETKIARYNDPDVKKAIKEAGLPQLEIINFSKNLNKEFNLMLERKTGVKAGSKISKARAAQLSKNKGKFNLFLPPNAEDFQGLLYKFLGKGKQGDADMKFFKENLFDPFDIAENAMSSFRQKLSESLTSLNKKIGKIDKDIDKETINKIESLNFTPDQAVRVWIWNKLGKEIPDLTNQEKTKLLNLVRNEDKLIKYAEELMTLTEEFGGYPPPSESWYASNSTNDLYQYANEDVRVKFLEEWQANADEIFSKENMIKIEALYGAEFAKNLKEVLRRMKSGSNRPINLNDIGSKTLDYINGSIGVIMFLNMRSAVLQTISAVNFLNWHDNNIFSAGKTLSDPKNFIKSFMEIMNSDFLKQRRDGLEINVSEAEIANAVERNKNKAKAIFSKIIKFGYKPTQFADSFAIAIGGTPFLINRTNTYIKSGLSYNEAREKAFTDFRSISEENQQSSRTDRTSNIQASNLGRLVFAFNNTPFQMTRLLKKATLDLINKRGDIKTNISKIIYYGAIQNIMFYSLQQAYMALLFGADEEDKNDIDNRTERMLNGILDTILRGSGMPGAIISTAKNTILEYLEQEAKGDWRADHGETLTAALNFSPPIGSKFSKLYSGLKGAKYEKTTLDFLKNKSKIVSSITNLPADRIVTKIDNLRVATSEPIETWKRLALFAGWDQWSLGVYDDLKAIEDKEKGKENKKSRSEIMKETWRKRKEEDKKHRDSIISTFEIKK